MTSHVPESIVAYIAAANRQDADAALPSFTPDAVVTDEGVTRQGPEAIRAWIEETSRLYRPRIEILGAETDGPSVLVAGRVSGTFPGSPADLKFAFTLAAGKIAALTITG